MQLVVGGQAVNLWAERYQDREPELAKYQPFTSKDLDLIGTMDDVLLLSQQTGAKSKLENLLNIEYIWSDLEMPQGSKLKDDFVDFVLITNILHQASQKENILAEAHRILRTHGHLAIIDWQEGEQTKGFGPSNEIRIAKDVAAHLATNQSFSLVQEFHAGNYHYGILFVK